MEIESCGMEEGVGMDRFVFCMFFYVVVFYCFICDGVFYLNL